MLCLQMKSHTEERLKSLPKIKSFTAPICGLGWCICVACSVNINLHSSCCEVYNVKFLFFEYLAEPMLNKHNCNHQQSSA